MSTSLIDSLTKQWQKCNAARGAHRDRCPTHATRQPCRRCVRGAVLRTRIGDNDRYAEVAS